MHTHFPGLRVGAHGSTDVVQGRVPHLVFRAVLPTFCPWILLPLTHVSPGHRPLTLLGEFCLCSRRQQGCAATGTPLLWGRPQTGALPTRPCTHVTPTFLVQLTNLGVGCLKEVADPSCLCLGQWSQCCRHHRVLLTTLLLPHRPQPLAETEWVGWYANSMQRTCKSSHCNHTALHGSISALTHAVQ